MPNLRICGNAGGNKPTTLPVIWHIQLHAVCDAHTSDAHASVAAASRDHTEWVI